MELSNNPVLESERLNYFKLSEANFEDFCRMHMDPEVMKYFLRSAFGTREHALESFKKYSDYQTKFPQLGGFMAYTKDDHTFVGLGVIIHVELKITNNKYEIGYRLPVNQWGKGYATEISRTMIDYGFNQLGYTELYGTTHSDHVESQKVLLKCGMKPMGTEDYGGASVSVFKLSKNE